MTNVNWETYKQLKRELQPEAGEKERLVWALALAKEAFSIGDKVKIKGTSYIGEVIGFRDKLGGFYPGVRFPLSVRIISTENPKFKDVPGSVFEYQLDQVEKV